MDQLSMDEANDLLSNGILVQTPRGLVCMSLSDALSSDLNLSVEDLQNVASQLLYQHSAKTKDKPLISVQSVQAINSNFVSSDGLGDSDGFTSESSDANAVVGGASSTIVRPTGRPKYVPVKLEHNVVEFVSAVDSKTTSDEKSQVSVVAQAELVECAKTPGKKRGGWPKGRKRKPELLHLPPKAPSTGYNLYLNDQRKLFKDSPLPFHEITKAIGNKWSSLSLKEKQPYLDKADEEKRRYREELRAYRQSGAYQLYLANKRRKRATTTRYNVLSESDMDATDDLDEEDNEELYCRTCDQYFHNMHNKKEHLLGRQHMQSVAGAIRNELASDYETDGVGNAASAYFSTSLDESSLDGTPNSKTDRKGLVPGSSDTVLDCMHQLINAIGQRDSEVKWLQRSVKDKKTKNAILHQQLNQLKEKENKLKKDMALLKEQEKDMEQSVYNLWQVPSWFVITDLNNLTEEQSAE